MSDRTKELYQALGKVQALRKQCLDTREEISRTKDEWHGENETHIGLMKKRVIRGEKNADIAYMNLVRARKLLS